MIAMHTSTSSLIWCLKFSGCYSLSPLNSTSPSKFELSRVSECRFDFYRWQTFPRSMGILNRYNWVYFLSRLLFPPPFVCCSEIALSSTWWFLLRFKLFLVSFLRIYWCGQQLCWWVLLVILVKSSVWSTAFYIRKGYGLKRILLWQDFL